MYQADEGSAEVSDNTTKQSAAELRFMTALQRFHELDADHLAAVGAARQLTEAENRARQAIQDVEERLAQHRRAPRPHRRSPADAAADERAEARLRRDLAEARAWLTAIQAAAATNEAERNRRGQLRNACEPLVSRLRDELALEVDHAQA